VAFGQLDSRELSELSYCQELRDLIASFHAIHAIHAAFIRGGVGALRRVPSLGVPDEPQDL